MKKKSYPLANEIMSFSFVLFFTTKRSLEFEFIPKKKCLGFFHKEIITDVWLTEGFSFAQLAMVKLLFPKSTAAVVAYDEVVPLRCNVFTPSSSVYSASFASLFKI